MEVSWRHVIEVLLPFGEVFKTEVGANYMCIREIRGSTACVSKFTLITFLMHFRL